MKFKELFTDSLYKNSMFLILNAGVMALFGFIFWNIAARLFTVAEVGMASALISAMGLIVALSTLGFNVALIRFLPKSKKKSAPDNAYFLSQIRNIEESFRKESIPLKMSMAGALMGIGLRNLELNKAALKVANKMGPIDFDERGKCDSFDVSKHLTSDHAKKKFGIY